MWSQLEEPVHATAKSYMWNTFPQPDRILKCLYQSRVMKSQEKKKTNQAAAVLKHKD